MKLLSTLRVMRGAAAAAVVLLLAACATAPHAVEPSGPDAKNARIRLELAEGYYQRGQPEVALGEVDKALDMAPDYVAAYNVKGLIQMSLGQPDQAEASFRKALDLAPANGDTLHNYGWFLCSRARYPQSFSMFERALKVPGYRSVERTELALGVCQLRAGQAAQAEATLRRGFALDPANPALATNLALALYRQHKAKDALFYVRRVNSGNAANAQSLWLGVLIARRADDAQDEASWTSQLTQQFPNSREAIAVQQGHFDDSGLLP